MNRIDHPDQAAESSLATQVSRTLAFWPAVNFLTASASHFDGDSRKNRGLTPSEFIDQFLSDRPVLSSPISAISAFIEGRPPGSLGLRLHAPLSLLASPNQRTFANPVDFACPFHPSSPSLRLRFRAERIGSWTSFDLSSGVLGNGFRASFPYLLDQAEFLTLAVVFPVPDDRRDMHFPRGKMRSGPLTLNFPLFLRESGSLRRDSTFSKHP